MLGYLNTCNGTSRAGNHAFRRFRNTHLRNREKQEQQRPIPDMTLIDLRPVEIQMRLVSGHWEGDLIVGKGNSSQVGTLVERTTLFVALVKLESAKADVAAEAFTKIFSRFESQMRRSMTYDQGTEMRHHKRLTQNTGVDVYFAHPRAPWERGINENTTACSASTYLRAPTCRSFPRSNWTTSPGCSTLGPG